MKEKKPVLKILNEPKLSITIVGEFRCGKAVATSEIDKVTKAIKNHGIDKTVMEL